MPPTSRLEGKQRRYNEEGQGMSFTQTPAVEGGSGRALGPRAGFWQRFGAVFIDGVLIGFINVILEVSLKGAGSGLALIVSAGYFTALEGGPRGQTIGKRSLGIRVISFDTGGPIGYGRAFVRWIGRFVSAIVFLLGYFWMLWDKEKQCWHDKFAGDVVVPIADYPV